MKELFRFESKREKYSILAIMGILFILTGITIYPSLSMRLTGMAVMEVGTEKAISKTPKEYYDMFKCPCCGQPIDADCCGMSKERKDFADGLMLEGLEENEIVYNMVTRFGFDILKDPREEDKVREYIRKRAPSDPPKIEINNPAYNFGTVKQTEGNVSTIFIVRNTGKKELIINNLETSCMCTSASMIYGGIEGPKFGMGMHGNNPKDYELIIPPGESAQLKVYYDPMAHGKQKDPEQRIIREITITSNDPVDFQKKLRIEITQIP